MQPFASPVALDFGLITCAKSEPSNCAKTRAADVRDVLVARGRTHCNACLTVYAVATRCHRIQYHAEKQKLQETNGGNLSLCGAFFLRHDVVFVSGVAQSECSKQTRMKHEKRGRNLEFVWCLCTKCCEKQSVTSKLCRVACRTVLCAAKLFSLPGSVSENELCMAWNYLSLQVHVGCPPLHL